MVNGVVCEKLGSSPPFGVVTRLPLALAMLTGTVAVMVAPLSLIAAASVFEPLLNPAVWRVKR